MADRVTREKRSEIMRQVRSRDTKPELIVRSMLHRMGFRFRLCVKNLPGTPDIVLPKYKTVIFVHGCFWHRHEGCKKATVPKTRTDWWLNKFNRNTTRDAEAVRSLRKLGWKVIVVWECEVKKRELEQLAKKIKAIIVDE